MNLFLDAQAPRVVGNLTAAIEALPPDVPKTSAWAGALQTLFHAYSYGRTPNNRKKSKSNGRFYVPPDIAVQIKPSSPYGCDAKRRHPHDIVVSPDSLKCHGESFTVNVRSSQQLADEMDWFQRVCSDFGKYADANLGREKVDVVQSDPWKCLTIKPSPFVHPNALAGLTLEPLFDAVDVWLNDQGRASNDAELPRWVWLAKTRPREGGFPYVYIYWPRSREMLRPWNPQGQRALVFEALERGSPRIEWNYSLGSWPVPDHEQELFKQKAAVDRLPHLLYVPVFRWLAIQVSFGPEQDPLKLLDDAYRTARVAPLIFLNCFREALFRLVLQFFSENPDSNPRGFHEDKNTQAKVGDIVRFIIEQYPTPMLNLGLNGAPAHLEAWDSADSLACAFAQQGNSSLELAVATASSRAEVTDYRNFGVTMMGTLHTLKRPVQELTSYVQRVMKEQQLSDDLERTSKNVLTHLAGVRVFTELELHALRPLFDRSFRLEHITPPDVFEVLRSSGYISAKLTMQRTLAGRNVWRLRDPLYNVSVHVSAADNLEYHSHGAMLALIFAELVDNAAHYIHDYLKRRRTAVVRVAFARGQITIANPILSGSADAVLDRVEKARWTVGRSLNRVFTLATMLHCKIEPSIPLGKQVLLTCRFPP